MSLAPAGDSRVVALDGLRVGEMLAEGGEGQVFELPLKPHLVYKQYRRPQARPFLETLVSWPLAAFPGSDRTSPLLASRVLAASAWPDSVVVDARGQATGILVPRAPRRFAVRHRDGTTRLSSLSYLTADPGHRAVAYGLDLPAPCGPPRVGLVYALARLLQAFESGAPSVGHGDLSTKNVLWSLQRGPEVFVIDCDNCDLFDPAGVPLGEGSRRRAMTPNWDDPAVQGGSNPTVYTDRYSLALIFLRVVGAANFPVQARQRQAGVVTVEFPVPKAAYQDDVLGPNSPVWQLCGRGLSVTHPEGRPSAGEWAAALESILERSGSPDLAAAARAAQGCGDEQIQMVSGAAPVNGDLAVDSAADVVINPIRRDSTPEVRWTKLHAAPPPTTPWLRPYVMAGARYSGPQSPPPPLSSPSANPVAPQVFGHVRTAVLWWFGIHLTALRLVLSRDRRGERLRAVATCGAVDVAVAVVGFLVTAMIAAPILGI